MDLKILLVLLFSGIASSSVIGRLLNQKLKFFNGERDQDASRNVTELITSKGYKCEIHTVQTQDGFILSMQRIMPRSPIRQRKVIFLQHGLLDSASTWVINQANQSLGFILSDQGYEVWLGNVRGNTYSDKHTTYNKKDPQFWDWSFDEMITYDLPAMLTHATHVSKVPSVTYIGHSQGTMIGFGMLANGNEPQSKLIEEMIALAPVAKMGNIEGIMRFLSDYSSVPDFLVNLFNIHEFLPSSPLVKFIASNLCRRLIFRGSCQISIYMGGLSDYNTNETRIPVYLTHAPAGTSVKNLEHYAQIFKSKTFRMFDYKEDNINHYNKKYPHYYNLTRIRTPIHFFTGGLDKLSDPQDVDWLKGQLSSLKSTNNIPEYHHLDFVWGMDAARKVYDKILNIIKE